MVLHQGMLTSPLIIITPVRFFKSSFDFVSDRFVVLFILQRVTFQQRCPISCLNFYRQKRFQNNEASFKDFKEDKQGLNDENIH